MKNSVSKRVVRITPVASTIFAVLMVFELLIMFGGLELDASLVRTHAPWAYEPFLKLVGEHPDQFSSWGVQKSDPAADNAAEPDSMATIAGFDPEQLSVTLEAVEGTNTVVVEPSVPDEDTSVLEPVVTPTDDSGESADEEVPVG